ncbi:MAG: hypothetical protein JWO38_1804 [Gemmataceae bacterium]|nr:hypothetical protein [Gemmataceae bacterium]
MSGTFFRPGVIALGLLGGAVPAPAQPPAAPAPQRQIVRWPGGWMYLDEPGVIYHDGSAPKPGSTTMIAGSANGVGNRIVVDNDGAPGVTVLRNVRNGVGNSVTVTPAGPVFDLSPRAGAVRPAVEYKGRATKFWTRKVYSEDLGYTMYWCPKTEWWFRYDKKADVYRPIPGDSDPAPGKK